MTPATAPLDFVFLHPGGANPRGLQGPYFPIGILGLAALLERRGLRVAIVNVMLERILDPALSAADVVRRHPARAYGIDLHWFVHCYEAIELARVVKAVAPNTPVVLGGLTASQFHDEILTGFEHVDAVIRGDAEEPLRRWVDAVLGGAGARLEEVPNLSYRSAGRVRCNPQEYRISQAELDALDFTRFDLVCSWDAHLRIRNLDYVPALAGDRSGALAEYYDPSSTLRPWIAYTGRGCPHRCSFCGGASVAFCRAFGRQLILRSPEVVASEIVRLEESKVDTVYVPHSPLIVGEAYHHRLLDELSRLVGPRRRLRVGFVFEDTPFLVQPAALRRYLELFDLRRSVVRLYVSDASAETAARNHFPPDLERITQVFDVISGHTQVMVGALIGVPGQSRASTLQLAQFLRAMKRRGAIVMAFNAELHPGSPIWTDPARFSASLDLHDFASYYRFLRNKTDKTMTYGYRPSNDVTVEEQREIVERHVFGRESSPTGDRERPPRAAAADADGSTPRAGPATEAP